MTKVSDISVKSANLIPTLRTKVKAICQCRIVLKFKVFLAFYFSFSSVMCCSQASMFFIREILNIAKINLPKMQLLMILQLQIQLIVDVKVNFPYLES